MGRPIIEDLRHDVWEAYQYPRTIPVVDQGAIVTYLVVPESISIREAQVRVNAWSTTIHLQIVMALDCHQWIVNTIALPDAYVRAIEEHRRQDLPRGGGEFLYPIPVHIPISPDRKVIFTVAAHDPAMVNAYAIKKDTRLWHMMQHLEGEYNAPGRLRISTFLFPIHITSTLWHLPGGVLVIHFLDKQLATPYHSFFNIDWHANVRWQAAEESQACWPPRAGTRSRHTVDQRAQMQIWAADRVQEHYPQLPLNTITFLLRAESRTVSSILNARSGVQVIEVIEAALRRAGLRREWFLQSVPVAEDDTVQPSANNMQQDQVVILLLSLQNQLAGQWQAINALSTSVVQLRTYMVRANQQHQVQDLPQRLHVEVEGRNQDVADDNQTQDYNMQAEDSPRHVPQSPDQDLGPQLPNQQPLSPTPVYSQPNLDEEIVHVSDSEVSQHDTSEHEGLQQTETQLVLDNTVMQSMMDQDEEAQSSRLPVPQQTEALQGEQQQPTREQMNHDEQDQQEPAGAQDQQDLTPDSPDHNANLFDRLEARAQRAREAQPGALRPFRR